MATSPRARVFRFSVTLFLELVRTRTRWPIFSGSFFATLAILINVKYSRAEIKAFMLHETLVLLTELKRY